MTSEKSYDTQQRLDALVQAQTDWANFGSFLNGWGPATLARYRIDLAGNVHVQFEVLSPGTTTNGTTILSSANGLPAGFRIGNFTYMPVRSDALAAQAPAIYVGSDGHMECFGIAAAATRVDCYFSFFAEN
jgi:hypothetical protein